MSDGTMFINNYEHDNNPADTPTAGERIGSWAPLSREGYERAAQNHAPTILSDLIWNYMYCYNQK